MTSNSDLPSFTLPDSRSGRPVSLWDYRHLQPVVLVFCGEQCGQVAPGFVTHYPDYRESGAEVLLIATSDQPPLDAPFPLLRDRGATVTNTLVSQTPAVLVLDRYGEVHARLEGRQQAKPDHRDLLEWVKYTESECPE